MRRQLALIGTVVLAAGAHAEDVVWKAAPPLGGPRTSGGMSIVLEPTWTADPAARIGTPQPVVFPRVLPDTVADGPRLLPPVPTTAAIPPHELTPPIVITTGPGPIAARPSQSVLIIPGPEFDRRPSPYNSAAVPESTRDYRPHTPPVTQAVPPAASDARPAPKPSQAPNFRLPPKLDPK